MRNNDMESAEILIRTNMDEVLVRMYENGTLVDMMTYFYDQHVTSRKCEPCPAYSNCPIRNDSFATANYINATCPSIIKEWLLRARE